jgi:ADP-heptose:LPS heptosyltransferase
MNLELGKIVDRWIGIPLVQAAGFLSRLRALVSPPPSLDRVRTIVGVKLWGVGNAVLLLPVLTAVRRRFPDARFVFVTLRGSEAILAANGSVDEVIPIDVGGPFRFLRSAFDAVRRLRRLSPDLALDFEQFCRLSALVGAASGARQRIGFRTPGQARAALYHAIVPYRDDRHMSETFGDIARAAGVVIDRYRPERITISDADRAAARALLPGDRKSLLVGMHPGSGDNFIGRRWPAESFGRLAQALVADYGATVVFTGSDGERSIVRDVLAAAPGLPAIDLTGKTPPLVLAAVIDACDVFFANDTGPAHVAAAMGVKLFAFYGPNTPSLYGPVSDNATVFYEALPCSPCLTNLNAKSSSCRLPVCIRGISVEGVLAAVRRSLEVEVEGDGARSGYRAPRAGL